MSLATALPFQPESTEFKFLLIMSVVIAHGSFYPYAFQPVEFSVLLNSLFVMGHTSPSDIAANVLLFMPFGFIGVRSMQLPFRPKYYVFIIALIGLIFAWVIQVLQLYFGGRVPSMHDVLWNFVGTIVGGVIGTVPNLRFIAGKRGNELWVTVPMLLAACWMLSRMVPLVPSLDLGGIKQGLKPLLVDSPISIGNVLRHMVSWLVFAHLLSAFYRRPFHPFLLIVVMSGVLLGQIIIEMRSVSLHALTGAFFALVVWFFVKRKFKRRAAVFAVLLILMLFYNGLKPFQLGGFKSMQWVPFYSYIEGSVNLWVIITFFEKMYIYGSLVWLFEEFENKWIYTATITTLSVLTIEVLQMFFGRTPEITDPCIVFLMALWVRQYRHVKHRQPRPRQAKAWSYRVSREGR